MEYDIGSIQQSIQSSLWSNRVVGNYEIVRKIGEGAFSSVFLAVHTITRHEVVLKSADKSQTNIASEIATMGLLSHPHIVRLYEYIIMPDKVWLVLEYCGGQELYNFLTSSTEIPPNLVGKLFAQLAGAVAYAHRLNCAHRDLKLENVLLDHDGNIKLGDFGFTRSYLPRTMLETVCGTESYMAPELVLRQKYNPEAADVWSLGVILYAMLYGRLPFDEDNSVTTVKHIVEKDPEFPPVVKGEYLIEIARMMLHKNPNQRPKIEHILGELKEPGKQQKQLLVQIVNHPESSFIFSTKEERTVLKGMKALGVDLHAVAASIMYHKCDALHGLWFTALDRQRSLSKQLLDMATVGSGASVSRRKSKSIKSPLSLNAPKPWTNPPSIGALTVFGTSSTQNIPSIGKETSVEPDESRENRLDQSFRSNDDNNWSEIISNHTSSRPSSVRNQPPVSNSASKQPISSLPPIAHSEPNSATNEPTVSDRSPANVPTLIAPAFRKTNPSSLTAFIERRSTGRSRKAVQKIMSALKLKRKPPKENLISYYDSVREQSQQQSISPSLQTDEFNTSRTLPTIEDDSESIQGLSSRFNQKIQLSRNPRSSFSSHRRSMLSLASSLSIPLEIAPPKTHTLSDFSVQNTSTISAISSPEEVGGKVDESDINTAVLKLHQTSSPVAKKDRNDFNVHSEKAEDNETQSPRSPQSLVQPQTQFPGRLELKNLSVSPQPSQQQQQTPLLQVPRALPQHDSVISQNSVSSRESGSPTPTSRGSTGRPVSTYSQLSQISQLSQSSVDASMLVADIHDPKHMKSSLVPKNIKIPRKNSGIARKFASSAAGHTFHPATSSTPPGTPNISRPRNRLISIQQKMPQKIEEGDE